MHFTESYGIFEKSVGNQSYSIDHLRLARGQKSRYNSDASMVLKLGAQQLENDLGYMKNNPQNEFGA